MVKRLRKRFVFITMFAVIVVLSIIIFSINIVNFHNVSKFSDNVLTFLAANDGRFPAHDEKDHEKIEFKEGLTNETPFETRFFTIKYNQKGEIEKVDLGRIAAIGDESSAVELAKQVLSSNKTKGYKDIYRFLVSNTDDGKMIIFVDCGKQLFTAKKFLLASVIVSVVGLLAVFLLVLLLSKKAILPIELSYRKQKEFITNASHELKTPITIISANNEINELENGKNENTECIKNQVSKMISMVKSMTMLSKIDEKYAKQEISEFDFSKNLNDAVDSFSNVIKTKKLHFNYECAENVIYKGNENLIKQLLFVLLDNAIKYADNFIDLKFYTSKKKLILMLRNDTSGIEIGNLNKYFERFYRSERNRANIDGTGIGLAIADEIVAFHKGKIAAYSEDGKIFNLKITL